MIPITMTCTCGHSQPGTREQNAYGGVHQCGGCGTVWAAIRPVRGGKVWIKVDESDVQFHCLMNPPEEEE